MGTIFFTDKPVYDFNSAKKADASKYAKFYREMLAQKIYLAPSPFEAIFLSLAHSEDIIKRRLISPLKALKNLNEQFLAFQMKA